MKSVDPILTAALEKGTGIPVMKVALFHYTTGTWTQIDEYDVLEAVLTREKYDLYVAENLLDTGLVDSIVDSSWAIQLERGLIVAGTKYSLVSNLYYISSIIYSEQEGRTHLIADLLPTTAIFEVDGAQAAHEVINDVFAQFNNLSSAEFDYDRDVWYDWKFYDDGKKLSLFDGRTLSNVLQQKYFTYLFPRWFHLIYIYGVPSNVDNPLDGAYTPFAHAQLTTFLWPDKPVNMSWTDQTGVVVIENPDTGGINGTVSLGFIDQADNPSALPKAIEWTRVFNGVCYQYIQRPDLRLEQGDLVTLPADSHTKVRCIEQIEIYKSRNSLSNKDSKAAWYQIVRQLPYHPQALATQIPIDWWNLIPGGINGGWGGWNPVTQNPGQIVVQSQSFVGALNVDASNIQQAMEILDAHNHDAAYAPAAEGVTNGNSHDHAGGDGAQIAYSGLSGLPTLGTAADNAETDFATAAQGVTNGNSHDHAGGDGAQIDHGGLAGLADDDHTQYIKHALATAASDFLAASGSGAFVKKTLAETKTILNVDKHIVQILLNTSTALTTGDNKARIRIPAKLNGLNLTGVAASRQSGTGVPSIQVRNVTDAVDMLSTALTIDSGETDSSTAATAAVINTSYDDVATVDQIAIDVDAAGTDTLSCIVELTFS